MLKNCVYLILAKLVLFPVYAFGAYNYQRCRLIITGKPSDQDQIAYQKGLAKLSDLDNKLFAKYLVQAENNPENKHQLIKAIVSGDNEIVRNLVFKVRNLNEPVTIEELQNLKVGIPGMAPLHYAVKYMNLEGAEILINAGADVNAKIVERRLKYRNCPAAHSGETALHLVARMVPNEESEKIMVQLLDLLLKKGAVPSIQNSVGQTPLHLAIDCNNAVIIEKLIEADNSLINIADNSGSVPLHLAVQSNNLELIERLLILGADINAQDKWGATALHKAYYVPTIRLLSKYDPDFDIVNDGTHTAQELAYLDDNLVIQQALIACRAKAVQKRMIDYLYPEITEIVTKYMGDESVKK